MLVFANGAFKSGSTWLYHLLNEMWTFERVPSAYQHSGWSESSIAPKHLRAALRQLATSNRDYISKNHFGSTRERDLILAHEGARVFNIERDAKDVVVSAFHYHRNVFDYDGSFDEYYWVMGRSVAAFVLRYNKVWSVPSENVLVCDFARLKSSFSEECATIARFLGLEATQADIDRWEDRTTLGSLRARFSEPAVRPNFFRKGATGEWQDYFTAEMVDDVTQIEASGLDLGTRAFLRIRRLLHPRFRRWAQ